MDAEEILTLQKLSYQSEVHIYGDYGIPPLVQTRYHMLKVEYESSTEEIKNLDLQFEKSAITPDNYQVQRFKLQNAKTKAKDELVDLQKTVKSELSARVTDLTRKIQSKLAGK